MKSTTSDNSILPSAAGSARKDKLSPMTNESILESVHTWAKEQGLNYEAVILSEPPAFLDLAPTLKPEDLPADHSGVCLTIREPEPTDEAPASLACWIPVSGKGGSYLMCLEGDDEIATLGKDWFQYRAFTIVDHDEMKKEGMEALQGNLDFSLCDFYQKYVFVTSLQRWLDGKGLKYVETEITECTGEAVEMVGSISWYVIEFDDPWEDYPSPNIIGVAGWGEVRTLSDACYGDDEFGTNGFIHVSDSQQNLRNAKGLTDWLDKNIILTK
jgi:hypothetical protein